MPRPLPSLILSRSPALRAAVFFGLYVVEGIPSGFALTAVANYLTARGLDSAAVGAFAARIGIPWTIQFAWGPLIDRFQGSPMGRRKPWVLGAQFAAFVASLGVVAVRDPVEQVTALSVAFLIHGLFASIQDASVDAMAISMIPEAERGRVNAFMRAGLLFGSGAGAAAWASLIRHHGFTAAALAQSAILLAMTVFTAFIRERPGDALVPWGRRVPLGDAGDPDLDPAIAPGDDALPEQSVGAVFVDLARGILAPRGLLVFALILVVYAVESIFIKAYSYHLIRNLGWTDVAVSSYSGTYGTIVGLATALAVSVVADRFGPRRLMLGVMALMAGYLIGFGVLGSRWAHPQVATAGLIAWYTFDPMFSIACMPILMGICRRGVEGSQFTAYMALVNLASVLGTEASGHIQHARGAPTIGVGSGVAVLAIIPLAAWALRDRKAPPMPEV